MIVLFPPVYLKNLSFSLWFSCLLSLSYIFCSLMAVLLRVSMNTPAWSRPDQQHLHHHLHHCSEFYWNKHNRADKVLDVKLSQSWHLSPERGPHLGAPPPPRPLSRASPGTRRWHTSGTGCVGRAGSPLAWWTSPDRWDRSAASPDSPWRRGATGETTLTWTARGQGRTGETSQADRIKKMKQQRGAVVLRSLDSVSVFRQTDVSCCWVHMSLYVKGHEEAWRSRERGGGRGRGSKQHTVL